MEKDIASECVRILDGFISDLETGRLRFVREDKFKEKESLPEKKIPSEIDNIKSRMSLMEKKLDQLIEGMKNG